MNVNKKLNFDVTWGEFITDHLEHILNCLVYFSLLILSRDYLFKNVQMSDELMDKNNIFKLWWDWYPPYVQNVNFGC